MAKDRRLGPFARLAKATAKATGRSVTFVGAIAFIVVWAATGPLFGYSDTWQLVVNTALPSPRS